MSQIDFKQHLVHAVSRLRSQGLSTAEVVALVIGDAPTSVAAPAPARESPRMVTIQLANGMCKNVPWTPEMANTPVPTKPAPANINTHPVTNAPCVTEWVKPEGFVPDVIPELATKPVVSEEREIVFGPSRGTTHDTFNERYEEEWVPLVGWERPTPAEKAEVDALTAEAEQEIAEMEAALAARRAEYAQFRPAMAGSDAS